MVEKLGKGFREGKSFSSELNRILALVKIQTRF